jgi:toxin ParE1/3/4
VVHRVVFRPRARHHLFALYRYIASQSTPETAAAYVARIEATCAGLSQFPERGTHRDDIARGVRTFGFERRVTIAFRIRRNTVEILSIAYAGRRFESDVSGEN